MTSRRGESPSLGARRPRVQAGRELVYPVGHQRGGSEAGEMGAGHREGTFKASVRRSGPHPIRALSTAGGCNFILQTE